MNRRRGLQQPGARRWLAGGLRLCLVCVGLALLVACQLPFSPTLSPTSHSSDAEIELISGKAWARPAGGEGWTEFYGHFSLLFGDQIQVPAEEAASAELRLADGTMLRLYPGTVLQLAQSVPPESRPVFRLVGGRIAVNAASSDQLFDIYVSVTEAFTYEFLSFVVDNQQAGTAFQLWLDGTTVHLVMGTAGRVRVYTEEDEKILEPEWEAWAELDGEIHTVKPRPSDTPTPKVTATPTHSPTLTVTPTPTVEPTPTTTTTPTPTLRPARTPTSTAALETSTPVVTPTPTVKPTAALPQVYQAPLLLEPYTNKLFGFDKQQTITLLWVPIPLAEAHWYEVQLGQEDEEPTGRYWAKENWWDMGAKYYPGDYYWRVVIVQGKEDDVVGTVSPPSETRYFQWVPVGPTREPTPQATDTPRPTNTPVPPTNTPVPPTNTHTPTHTPRPP